jgi:hypothetical protein
MNDTMRRFAVVLALAFTLAPAYAQQPLNPPLKNWASPLFWAPTPAEAEQQRIEQRITHPEASSSPLAQAASIFTPPGPMTFIALTPCRVMDTRTGQGFTGAFGPPSLAAYASRSIPMPTSTTCSIPSNAGAYSLNITVVPPGPLSFLSVWPAGAAYPNVSTLNDPVSGGVVANAAIVVAGTSGAIQMVASNPTDVIIDINGYYANPTDPNGNTGIGMGALTNVTTAVGNTATGYDALNGNTSGFGNTANGSSALLLNTTGGDNTALGFVALEDNTTGNDNTALGAAALRTNTTGSDNTASGFEALQLNTTGYQNTAGGYQTLQSNTTGYLNTATGAQALQDNTAGYANTANGVQALQNNTTGAYNTASGYTSLQLSTTGGGNTAIGYGAMLSNTTGSSNTALGFGALVNNTTGFGNIVIGEESAFNVAGGNSNNIIIGSEGTSSDNGVIRIGDGASQTSAYMAGIYGQTASGGIPVYVNSSGKLATANSSRRFKEQITDMGDTSSKLFQLRPVNFFYKPEYDDGSHLLQYGLIAEEVEKVYPEMVAYDKDGQILTVKYQLLAPMLLNEAQKQDGRIQQLEEQNRKLEDRLAALEALLSGQAAKTEGRQ